MPREPKLGVLGLVQILWALPLILGAAVELMVETMPSLLPEAPRQMIALLHADPLVRGWMILLNVIIAPAAVAWVAAGVWMRRGLPRGVLLTRRLAVLTLTLAILGQIILGATLYPSLLNIPGDSPMAEAAPGLLIGMMMSGVALAGYPIAALFVLRRVE